MLSDADIQNKIGAGAIQIEGSSDLYIGPASVDLHLDNKAKILLSSDEDVGSWGIIDTKKNNDVKFETYNGWERIFILPGLFYILSTTEHVTLSNKIAGFVHGRSSLARLGLNIHMAGFVDPGFSGTITLEVTNFTQRQIILYRDMRIGQMTFIETDTPSLIPYNEKKDSKYVGQQGPTLSKLYND